MFRPFGQLTDLELGSQFAAAVRLGGRPVTRRGDQLSYPDLVLEMLLDEFRSRSLVARAAALALAAETAQAYHEIPDPVEGPPF